MLDGHGDLTAGDIFCLADGPRILDCLEFDDRLRYVDQLDDIAFLAMDLEHLGASRHAAVLLAAYLEYTSDPSPPALLHHFLAYRAFVRAKVVGLRSTQEGAAQTSGIEARRFADQARRHLRAGSVQLVLVGGPPGSGKSTLSGHVADRFGMTVLSSDRLRKELAGLAPDVQAASAYGQGLYTDAWSDRTYGELLHRAEVLLGLGESVVVDASWVDSSRRAAAARLAQATSSRLVGFRCALDAETADARIRARASASDADPVVARHVRDREDRWPEAVEVDTTRDPVACADQACSVLRPRPAPASMPPPRTRRPAMPPD